MRAHLYDRQLLNKFAGLVLLLLRPSLEVPGFARQGSLARRWKRDGTKHEEETEGVGCK